MTPEEINRTIEFIVQTQARLAAAQEQDREERIRSEKESKALDRRLARLFEISTHMLEHQDQMLANHTAMLEKQDQMLDRHAYMIEKQSQILDNQTQLLEKQTQTFENTTHLMEDHGKRLAEHEKENRTSQQRHDQLMNEIRATLNRLFDKLSDRLN